MLRAMDSAVSGLRAHQNKLDVIGNNIANVNTFGYKSQNYSFKEAMYQTSSASTGGTANAAGSNGAQYGFGSLTGAIAMDMNAGTPTYTGGFNALINGTGFFITSPRNDTVENESDAMKSSELNYTRVGQFSVDSNGYIVDPNNNFIMGFGLQYSTATPPTDPTVVTDDLIALKAPTGIDANGNPVFGATGDPLVMKSVEITKLGEITAKVITVDPNGVETSHTVSLGRVAVANFQNPEGLTKNGGNGFGASPTDNSGDVIASYPGSGSTGTLMTGYLEQSNVDLAKEMAEMIITQRGFQANSKIITVSDEILGDLISMKR